MKTKNCQSNPEGQKKKNKTKQEAQLFQTSDNKQHSTALPHTHTRINATERAQKQTQCNRESPEADPMQQREPRSRPNATARAQKQTQCNSESPEADPMQQQEPRSRPNATARAQKQTHAPAVSCQQRRKITTRGKVSSASGAGHYM